MPFAKEKEFLQKYIEEFAQIQSKKFPSVLFYEFLKYVHKDTPELAEKIASLDPKLASKVEISRSESKYLIKSRTLVKFYFLF